MAIGARAKERREELGLTQEQVAQRCSITQSTLSSMERRDATKFEHLEILAKALNTNSHWLLTGEEPKNRHGLLKGVDVLQEFLISEKKPANYNEHLGQFDFSVFTPEELKEAIILAMSELPIQDKKSLMDHLPPADRKALIHHLVDSF